MKRIVTGNLAAALLALALSVGAQSPQTAERQAAEREAPQARMTDGKTLFNEKCATVAGEKIYRRVENVEGLLLMKVRPQAGDSEWSNRDWPGAAFAREFSGDSFIRTFLGYEYPNIPGRPVTPKDRGYINVSRNPGGLPGYRWVEVLDAKDGKRYRYTIAYKPRPTSKIGYIDAVLDKNPSPSTAPPRYGVTYEDHVIPEERYLGLASSTVRIIDLETKEVLGEMTQYAWSPGAPSRINPSPWLTAYRCIGNPNEASAATRQFADQILIPAKEK